MSHKSKKRKISKGAVSLMATPQIPSPHFVDFELMAARHEVLRYRLAPECKVQLQFDGIATQEAIRKLIQYLEMGISDFPRNTDNS
jgi:hypothetical protein